MKRINGEKKFSWKRVLSLAAAVVAIISIMAGTALVSGAAGGAEISLQKAKEIALKHAGVAAADAFWDSAELDYDDGVAVYELDFCCRGYEYEFKIDACSGKILCYEQDRCESRRHSHSSNRNENHHHNNNHRHNGNNQSAGAASGINCIGLEKAKELALKKAGCKAANVTFTKAKLECDNSRACYNIEFYCNGFEYEVELDAQTGKIRGFDKDKDERYFYSRNAASQPTEPAAEPKAADEPVSGAQSQIEATEPAAKTDGAEIKTLAVETPQEEIQETETAEQEMQAMSFWAKIAAFFKSLFFR